MAPTSYSSPIIMKMKTDISGMKKIQSDPILSNKVISDAIDGPTSLKFIKKSLENLNLLETMISEKNRYKSFEGKWPLHFISIKNLVDSGFFYLQSEDKVQCAFCGLILHSWKSEDDPLKEHIKSSPKCCYISYKNSFVTQRTICQPPTSYPSEYIPQSSPLVACKPTFPHMHDFDRRLATYKNWQLPMFRPKELADCGFFYTGDSDIVTCFYCGGSLKNWEPIDVPLNEHSKNYPHCKYLQIIKNRPMQKMQEVTKNKNLVTINQSNTTNGPVTSEIPKSEIIQRAKQIFPPVLVDEVILKGTGQTFTSLHQLCGKILQHEEQLKKRSKCADPKTDKKVLSEMPERPNCSENTKDIMLCKICMDQDLEVVFQPCGHLVSCEECAGKISECPLCRKPITDIVRTYFG